jgi:hypothetical protein
MNSSRYRLLTAVPAAVPLIADSGGFLLMALLFDELALRFQLWSMANLLLAVAVYLFFGAAVYTLQKLEPATEPEQARLPDWLWSRPLQATFGVLFAVVMMIIFSYQLGYLDLLPLLDIRRLGSGESAALLALAPGAWFAFALFYTLLLISTFDTAVPRQASHYPWLALVALFITNSMLLLIAANLRVLLGQSGATGNVFFLPVFLLLLLLFAPPRLIYLRRQPRASAYAGLLLLLVYSAALTVYR